MKSLPFVSILLLAGAAPGQDERTDPGVVSGKTGTFIPHPLEVTPFVPPDPPPLKRMPPLRVDAAVAARQEHGRSLGIVRAERSEAPDLPPFVKESTGGSAVEEPPRAPLPPARFIMMGATIYDHRISLANWADPATGANYEALCRFDLGLLSGIGDFISEGKPVSLVLVHSHSPARDFPGLAQIPEGGMVLLAGDPDSASGMAPILALRDLIMAEKGRLTDFQAARRAEREARIAWEKAHPPIPRDEVYWFRPHRGSRYLADPAPEKSLPQAEIRPGRLDLLTTRRAKYSPSRQDSATPQPSVSPAQ